MNLSNDGLVTFHYRAYGTFFYNKIGSIISIGDLPTTNIIEPFFQVRVDLFFMSLKTRKRIKTLTGLFSGSDGPLFHEFENKRAN